MCYSHVGPGALLGDDERILWACHVYYTAWGELLGERGRRGGWGKRLVGFSPHAGLIRLRALQCFLFFYKKMFYEV